jgi:hypothetical protein
LTDEEVADNTKGGKEMEPGNLIARDRGPKAVDESVMVFSLQFNSQTEYLPRPVTYVATPGVICAIVIE